MRISGQLAAGLVRPAGAISREPLLFEERPVGDLLARYRRQLARRIPVLSADVAFLARHGVPYNTLELASRLAASRGTEPRQELFAIGFDRKRYWAMLADELGLRFAADLGGAKLHAQASFVTTEAIRHASSLLVEMDGAVIHVLAPRRDDIAVLRAHLRDKPAMAERLLIATPETIRAFLVERRHTALTHYAVNRLAHIMPGLSARRLNSIGGSGPATLLSATLGLSLLSPGTALIIIGFLFTLFFFNCSLWKLAAAFGHPRQLRAEPLASEELPTYTLLIPLYREAAVVADLAQHLAAIDYPASKLQILFILEADDGECRAAVARHAVSPLMETVTVPPGGPRTKPKALTYALPFARGDFVVVFDAEDRPEPDQLRKAAAAFHGRPHLGCVQARLSTDNEEGLLARLFKLEYAANFEVLLPALASWQVPLPLGGTSNHFPRKVLEKVGAWDPYNVTEDADLGIRLARFGYDSATIPSRTWEEAPVTFRQWLPQRRRWIKGWIQTSLLCLPGRIPIALRLPFRQSLAVHGILTAGVLGLLLYPASVLVVLITIAAMVRGEWPGGPWVWFFLVLNCSNLVAILMAAFGSALRGLGALGALRLVPLIPLLPLYWCLMSLAAWQALFQFVKDPSGWEKTTHGVARNRQTPPQSR